MSHLYRPFMLFYGGVHVLGGIALWALPGLSGAFLAEPLSASARPLVGFLSILAGLGFGAAAGIEQAAARRVAVLACLLGNLANGGRPPAERGRRALAAGARRHRRRLGGRLRGLPRRPVPEPRERKPVKRAITGFHTDEDSDWVAELACGHGQHVRHNPPLAERLWVLTADGRAQHLGSELDCPLCDRSELPEGYAPYRRTPVFEESSVPEALQRRHSTKGGVWARIHVERGSLDYHLHEPFLRSEQLTPDSPGTVLPEVEHHVEVTGPVAFFVEFWRAGGEEGS